MYKHEQLTIKNVIPGLFKYYFQLNKLLFLFYLSILLISSLSQMKIQTAHIQFPGKKWQKLEWQNNFCIIF